MQLCWFILAGDLARGGTSKRQSYGKCASVDQSRAWHNIFAQDDGQKTRLLYSKIQQRDGPFPADSKFSTRSRRQGCTTAVKGYLG